MGDPLRQAIAEVVRDMLPANDHRQWRRIDAEAVARGFKSTRSFREWCLARGVPVREDNHKDTWVDVAGIDPEWLESALGYDLGSAAELRRQTEAWWRRHGTPKGWRRVDCSISLAFTLGPVNAVATTSRWGTLVSLSRVTSTLSREEIERARRDFGGGAIETPGSIPGVIYLVPDGARIVHEPGGSVWLRPAEPAGQA